MDYLDKFFAKATSPEFVKILVLPLLGALANHLWRKFQNRTIALGFSAKHNNFARSSEDLFGGKLQVLFRGKEVKGLYTTETVIENNSITDLENLIITFEYRNEEQFHGGSGKISDSTKKFLFSPDFQQRVDRLLQMKDEDQAKKSPDFTHVMRTREFIIPVLNRGCRAEFSFLTHSEKPPVLYAQCLYKGVKIVKKNEERMLGLFFIQSIVFGLVASIVLLILIIPLFSSIGWAMTVAFVLGVLSSGIGLGIIALGKLVKRIFS